MQTQCGLLHGHQLPVYGPVVAQLWRGSDLSERAPRTLNPASRTDGVSLKIRGSHNVRTRSTRSWSDRESRRRVWDFDRRSSWSALPRSQVYSAVPQNFDQSALVLDYPGHPPLRSLPAEVWRGHFERVPKEERIIDSTPLGIGEVVHFREFLPGGPRLEPLGYVLFGRGGETFAAHLLSAPPDFDQVLTVQTTTQAQLIHPSPPPPIQERIERAALRR